MKARAYAFVVRRAIDPKANLTDCLSGRAFKQGLKYAGGVGFLLLVRYTHSPIGPYDELAFVPGDFVFKGKRHAHANILFVSTESSVKQGREIWGFPKHLAHFDWSGVSRGMETVAITLHNNTEPFFRAKIQTAGVKVPFSSSWLPRS